MKLKHLALAVAIVGLSTSAFANNINTIIPVVGGTNYYGAVHVDSLNFTDTFTFNVAGPVQVSASLITIGFLAAQNIDFLSVDLNGIPLALSGVGNIETAVTPAVLNLVGPLVLTVSGASGASGGTFASYAGTINIVPEPGTLALLFAGLGGIQVMGRRTRRA